LAPQHHRRPQARQHQSLLSFGVSIHGPTHPRVAGSSERFDIRPSYRASTDETRAPSSL
jgi:hypothetical protein